METKTFSLMYITRQYHHGPCLGSWVQDHIGTLETAQEKARATEKVNSNHHKVTVCQAVNSSTPILSSPMICRPLETH